MPTPDHKPHYEMSAELKALLAAQRPTPRWLYRLRRLTRKSYELLKYALLGAIYGLLTSCAIVGTLLMLYLVACAPKANAQPLDIDRLLPALVKVESNGNPRAVGDGGRALGALQVWSCVLADVNRVHGTRYVHADAFDRAKAERICRLYLAIYCTPRRLGRQPTMEDAARIWNGGPNGHRKSATEKYWQKVAKAL